MNANDSTDSTRRVNPVPVLVPGALYLEEDLYEALNVSWDLMRQWEKKQWYTPLRTSLANNAKVACTTEMILEALAKMNAERGG